MSQVSLQQLVDYFKEANEKYFKNFLKLDMKYGTKGIKIDITSRATKRLGVFIAKNGITKIVLSEYILRNDLFDDYGTLEWKNTLTHELVHAWQYFTFAPVDHGPLFHHKAAVIKRLDPKMVIDTLASGEQITNLIQDRDRKKKGLPTPAPIRKLATSKMESYILYVKGSKKYFFITGKFQESALKTALDLAKRSGVMVTLYKIASDHAPKNTIWNDYDSLIDFKADVISSLDILSGPYSVEEVKEKFYGNPDSHLDLIYSWKNS